MAEHGPSHGGPPVESATLEEAKGPLKRFSEGILGVWLFAWFKVVGVGNDEGAATDSDEGGGAPGHGGGH